MTTNSALEILADSFRSSLRHAVYLSRSLDTGSELSVMQVSILNMAASGSRVSVIATNLGIRVPSATEQIIKLEKAGLVSRDKDPEDARAVQVTLTPEGQLQLNDANVLRNARMAELLEPLTDTERAALAAAIPVIEKLNSKALEGR